MKFFRNTKVILVENNGKRKTFLDHFGVDVFYTENNFSNMEKGAKELKDILDCIQHYNISDDDFIVKMTGRYILQSHSLFMNHLEMISSREKDWHCIIRYGSFFKPVDFAVEDCITALIGMLCKYVKRIDMPAEQEVVEWKWAEASLEINRAKVAALPRLGIAICPGSHKYFLV